MRRPQCNSTVDALFTTLVADPEAWGVIEQPPCQATMRARLLMFAAASLWVDVGTWIFFHYWYRYLLAGLLGKTGIDCTNFCLTFLKRVRTEYVPAVLVRPHHLPLRVTCSACHMIVVKV